MMNRSHSIMASKPNPKLPGEQQETMSVRPPSRSIFRAITTRLFGMLPAVGFLFLTFNVVTAAYHARQDPASLAFVLWCYVNLLLLFWCLKQFENLEADSPSSDVKRERLKVAIWVLATLLNLTFAWRVAGIMPLPLAVVIWAMAGFVAVAGFYGLFIFKDGNGDGVQHQQSCSDEARLRDFSPGEKV